MAIVNDKKLEAVANLIGEMEVEGCEGDCPFYSKENFIKWIKKPDSKYDVSNLKRPQQEDFIGYDNVNNSLLDKDGHIKALEKYCNNLGDALADAEYAFEEAECENRELIEKLSKIRGVLDEGY